MLGPASEGRQKIDCGTSRSVVRLLASNHQLGLCLYFGDDVLQSLEFLCLDRKRFNLSLQTIPPGFYLRNFQANLTRVLLGLGDRIGQSKTE